MLRYSLVVVALQLVFTTHAAAAEKPNILFIFADDLTYQAVHALGNDEIQTPNLDTLVRDGTTFSHCYNQGGWNGAVCVASRAMLITGRYLWHAEKEQPKSKQLYSEKKLLWPQVFEQAGYNTYFTGKWHIRVPAEEAFTVARHVRPGMPKITREAYNRPLQGQPDVWKPWDRDQGGFWQGGKHWSEVVADDCIDYLEQSVKSDKPFFMYIAFNAPHDPRQSPIEYVNRYSPTDLKVPKSFLTEYPYQIGSNKIRDEKLAPFPRTHHAVQVHRQEYYAIISHMDDQIGRILKRLRETGQADNTYIVFTADHGLSVGHHGLVGKQNMYNHSMRVPFMIVGPDMPAGKKNSSAIYLQDIVPTSMELAGLEVPEHVEFHSLIPLVKGESPGNYPTVYGAYTKTQRSVIHDGHKLILYPEIKKSLLFDLKADPEEITDLSDQPGMQMRMKEMAAEFVKLQQETGDELDVRTSFPELFSL